MAGKLCAEAAVGPAHGRVVELVCNTRYAQVQAESGVS